MKKTTLVLKAFLIFIIYIYLSVFMELNFKILTDTNNTICMILSNLVVLLVISLFFIPRLVDDFKKLKKNDYKIALKNWLIGLLIMYLCNIIIALIIGDIASNEAYNRDLLFKNPMYSVWVMIIIAPITEELIFRLSIKDIFKNKWIYAVVSGLIFGLMHMMVVKNPLELLYIISYGSLGFMFAKTVYETDNIWWSIFTHMIHNGAIIGLLFLAHLIGV